MDPTNPRPLPALLTALRNGKAGFAPRLAVSLAAAAAILAALMLIFGTAGLGGRRAQEQVVAFGFLLAVGAWGGALCAIWATYGRRRRVLKTVFLCLMIVTSTIATAILIGTTLHEPQFFVAAILFLGAAALIAAIAAAIHSHARGRDLNTAEGHIHVACSKCGYSMAGLDNCTCPECGQRYTLDSLIRAQDYEALRIAPPPTPDPAPRPGLPARAALMPEA